MAGPDLKGLLALFNCGIMELNFPMIALVDYRGTYPDIQIDTSGFRLVCMSTLPVSSSTLACRRQFNSNLLLDGSCDGGYTVTCSNDVIKKKMDEAGKFLNLRPHKVAGNFNLNILSIHIRM